MEVQALLQDQYLTAPYDGEIDVIYPHESELVSLGTPIMSLLKIQDKWVTFNVREQLLGKLTMGTEIEIEIPYAAWRATKATGEWDSRTFQVKVRPNEPVDDLRPGMTVIWHKPN